MARRRGLAARHRGARHRERPLLRGARVRGKRAGRAFSPLAITCLHAPVAALALLAVFGRQALPPALDAGVLRMAAGGIVCGIGGSVLFFNGLARVSTQVAGTLTYLEPIAASVLAVSALGEPLAPLGLLGGAVVVACGVWVACNQPRGAESTRPPAGGVDSPSRLAPE